MRFGTIRPPRVRSVPRALAASALVVAALSGGVAAAASRVGAHPALPPLAPDRLLASVIRAARTGPPVSGTVSARLDLGLPSFPEHGPAPTGLAGLLAELGGDHRIRVWSSADGYRVDELLPTAERAIYVGAGGGWLWSSDDFTAVRLYDPADLARLRAALAARRAEDASEMRGAELSRMMQLFDPLTLARQALAGLSPTTSVTVGPTARVAGRPAYVLRLAPKDPTTLVGRVDVAVDGVTRVPLSVAVFAKGGGSAALSVGFTSVSYRPVPPSVYRFEPPRGAIVKALYQEQHRLRGEFEPPGGKPNVAASPVAGVRVFGSGWSTIVAIRVPGRVLSGSGASSIDGVDVRRLLPFSGPLFSVRMATAAAGSWLVMGAVPQRALAAVEPGLR